MAKTVVGLFDSLIDAQNAVQDLVNNGVSREYISLVANDARGEFVNYSANEVGAVEGAGAGAIGGGVLGGVLGMLIGIGALAIPGIGPVLAAGPLAAALGSAGAGAVVGAGVGALSGGLLGALIGAGVPEEHAHYYAEGVRRGGTLVSISSVDEMTADKALGVLRRHNAVNIDTRGAEWRSSGWNRFDPTAEPYRTNWEESSKVGTATGAGAGAITGAAVGSVAGPIGTVAGGVAGAAAGGALGAAADSAAEGAEDEMRGEDDLPNRRRY